MEINAIFIWRNSIEITKVKKYPFFNILLLERENLTTYFGKKYFVPYMMRHVARLIVNCKSEKNAYILFTAGNCFAH